MTGHVLIDASGRLVSLDEGFCAIMQAPCDSLLGRPVADITAPADREECDIAIQRLIQHGTPFVISKRFIRDDGSLVWVRNTVSISVPSAGPPLIIATIEPLKAPRDDRSPGVLLECAQRIIRHRRMRTLIADGGLFSDPAWDITLLAYVTEASGRALDVGAISEDQGLSPRLAAGWITALVHHRVLELELGHDPYANKSYRLTTAAHDRLEQYLRGVQDNQWVRVAA
ncbi:PAS domain-containing protein [Sphingomonas naphthae]|uniref:PAS domain-containing protein n=1 Tax=Sphingomonas naphthae TaxID=1813468 RepID=A0ABY7TGX2_9SPHN|nr:PAS domain-containing protein [Sphingomonas naphthae]WCT72410.1 PAS domain-containing protein [Sphingomonas naphthae]